MDLFRQLDDSGDWLFGKGNNDIARDNRAIGLDIKTRILSWFGDCFFDAGAGVDWYNRIGTKDDLNLLELDLRRIILLTEGVTGIIEFNFTLNGREFLADYSVETIYTKSYIDQLEATV